MNTAIATLLYLAASLLGNIQPDSSMESRQEAILFANRAIHVANIAIQKDRGEEVFDGAKIPTSNKLSDALYRNDDGGLSPLGSRLQLLQQYTSFGDLNADNFDDAVVVVKAIPASGTPTYHLAAMANYNGELVNVANASLENFITIHNHRIDYGYLSLDLEANEQPRRTIRYKLNENKLVVF